MSTSALSVGVDAWRKGWVAVVLTDGRFELAMVSRDLRSLLDGLETPTVAAVDIPIGIDGGHPREADREARRFVGARASSVFNAPHRISVSASTHTGASAESLLAFGKGVTQQAYALRSKILEADALVRQGYRLIEGHPEVSYRALSGEDLPPKSSWAGIRRREQLLASVAIRLPDDLGRAGVVPPDDLLDAAVLAWTARRYRLGTALSLPANAAPGDTGVIWY